MENTTVRPRSKAGSTENDKKHVKETRPLSDSAGAAVYLLNADFIFLFYPIVHSLPLRTYPIFS